MGDDSIVIQKGRKQSPKDLYWNSLLWEECTQCSWYCSVIVLFKVLLVSQVCLLCLGFIWNCWIWNFVVSISYWNTMIAVMGNPFIIAYDHIIVSLMQSSSSKSTSVVSQSISNISIKIMVAVGWFLRKTLLNGNRDNHKESYTIQMVDYSSATTINK